MSERRSSKRYDVSLAAEVRQGSVRFGARAKNLSRDGVGLEIKRAVDEGATIEVSVFLVEEGIETARTIPIDVQGKVAWVAAMEQGGYQIGIHFLSFEAAQQELLKQYLARLAENEKTGVPIK